MKDITDVVEADASLDPEGVHPMTEFRLYPEVLPPNVIRFPEPVPSTPKSAEVAAIYQALADLELRLEPLSEELDGAFNHIYAAVDDFEEELENALGVSE